MAYGFNKDRSRAENMSRSYSSMADMLSDLSLSVNDICTTLGALSPSDGGNASYIITDNPNMPGADIKQCANGLYAVLVPTSDEGVSNSYGVSGAQYAEL